MVFDRFFLHELVLVRFGFITGSCGKERLKAEFTAHQTID